MEKIMMTALLAFCCITTAATQQRVSLISILKTLTDQSYTVIKLEYEHDVYEANVLTPEGFLQKIKFDQNGDQIFKKERKNRLTMSSALELVAKKGYYKLSSIKISGDHTYKIDAIRASDQKEVDIKVNAETGEVTIEREWWDIFT